MGKNWRIVLVTLLVGISLASCGPKLSPTSAPTPTSTSTPTTTPAPTPISEAYPAPSVNVVTETAPAQDIPIDNLYPGPSEGSDNYLGWTKVEKLILDGKVSKMYHAPDRHITVVLKDGSVALTLGPGLEGVFKVIEQCGQACSDIEQIEE